MKNLLSKTIILFVAFTITTGLLLTGCEKKPEKAKAAAGLQVLKADDKDEVQAINPKNIGPNGDAPVGVDKLVAMLTADDEEKVIKGNHTAAVAFVTAALDWSRLQEKGIREVLDQYKIKLLTVADAEIKVEKQISDIEAIIALKPDLLIGFCVDRTANAPVFRKAAEAGITLAFIDTIPIDFKYPQDYKGMGLADNYQAGVAAAEIVVDAINKKGKVGVMWFPISMFHVDQRYNGIMETLNKYPEINVIDVQNPGSPEQAATVAENWLIAHPDLAGIVTIWDAQALGASGVVESSRKNVKIAGVDLSEDSAYAIASGSPLIGVASQHPYDQGIAEAMIGVLALAGKTPPPYVLVPIEKVTRKSIERSYKRVFRKDPEGKLKDVIAKLKAQGIIAATD